MNWMVCVEKELVMKTITLEGIHFLWMIEYTAYSINIIIIFYRVKTELMCELSKTDLQANVIIIGATNCPWDLDPAILRRFQKKIYVPLPNAKERVELFQLLAENIEINSQDQLKRLIDISEGYSGSDISALVQNALIIPLTELQDTTLWKKTADGFFEPDLYYFGEQMSMPSSTETLFSHLCNLPPCSIRARPINVEDLITAAKHIQVTVNTTELEKYYDFMNQK